MGLHKVLHDDYIPKFSLPILVHETLHTGIKKSVKKKKSINPKRNNAIYFCEGGKLWACYIIERILNFMVQENS